MKVISIKDFKDHATSILRNNVENGESIILTKRKKPIALIKPFSDEKDANIAFLTNQIGAMFKEANISEKDALDALDAVRNEIYGK